MKNNLFITISFQATFFLLAYKIFLIKVFYFKEYRIDW